MSEPTFEQPAIYEQAVTTNRTAEKLARRHGFGNIDLLAESLPEEAQVLDVGAGASPFGIEVAMLRPDVDWINFDYSYHDPAILEEVSLDAPPNVKFVQGDATTLENLYAPGSFDAVFSYWLLPHLSLDNPQPAQDAARGIFTVTKPGGTMSVGPIASLRPLNLIKGRPAVRATKDETLDIDSYADMIVAKTTLSGVNRAAQRLFNETATPFFGTTRYTRPKGRNNFEIFDPRKGEYVPRFSQAGLATSGRLVVAAARLANEQRKSKHK